MMPAWVLLGLAALPCEDSARQGRELREWARSTPDSLAAHLQELEPRWDGLSLRDAGEHSPAWFADTAAERLQTACTWLEETRREPAVDSRTDPARLQEILSRPEFARARQRPGDVIQRLLRLLKDWLESLLETRQAQSFATSTRTGVLVLGFAAVLFAVLRLRHWKRGPGREHGSASEAPAPAALRLDSPGEHLMRARTALGTQPREAIRQGLLALLSSLEARKLARPDRVKTNRELVDELPVRGAPASLTREVERLVRWYDRAFYSLEPVLPAEAARFVDEVERFHHTGVAA